MHVHVESLEGRRLLAFSLATAGPIGGANGAEVVVSDVATDSAGHVFVSGEFKGTVDFDIRKNHSNTLTSAATGTPLADTSDGFLAKYAADGRLLWVRQVQILGVGNTTTAVSIGKLAVDEAGNAILTGSFNGTVDFNPRRGRFAMTAQDDADAFVWKLNSDGWLVWAKQLGNLRGDPRGAVSNAVAVDAAGDVVVTGTYYSDSETPEGRGFVARLAGDTGGLAYNKPLPTDALIGNAIAADREGHVLIVGKQVVGGESRQTYVTKVNRRGNAVWYTEIGGETKDWFSQGVAVNKQGAVFVGGAFAGTGTFGSTTVTAAGDSDAFLARLDATGGVVWAKAWGANDNGTVDSADDVALDAAGNVVVSGRFANAVDFDPGAGTAVLDAGGSADAYVARFTAAGVFDQVGQIGGKDGRPHRHVPVAWSRRSGVFTAGTFSGTIDLDPGAGASVVQSKGKSDGFLVRLLDA